MGSKWRNAKLALGLNLCVYVPPGGTEDGSPPVSEKCSDAALFSPLVSPGSWCLGAAWLSKSFSRSSNVASCENILHLDLLKFLEISSD